MKRRRAAALSVAAATLLGVAVFAPAAVGAGADPCDASGRDYVACRLDRIEGKIGTTETVLSTETATVTPDPVTETATVTDTATVTEPPVTETATVTAPPVTATATETATVTEPAAPPVTVTQPPATVTVTATPTSSTSAAATTTSAAATTTTAPADPAVLAGWGAPVFRDEFNGTALDTTKWNVRTRANFGLGIDAGVPEAANVTTSGGLLHIKGEWLADAPQTRTASATGVTILTHTTGYIDQRPLKAGDYTFAQTYGRWEIRAKTPTGPNTRGSLAAFWLRPNDRTGEIDIMEAWGGGGTMAADWTNFLKDTAATTIHTKTDGTGTKKLWRHKEFGGPVPVWDAMHTYVFEYMPTYAATYVDGVQIMRVTPQADGGTYLWDQRYFGSPMHVRLNMHIGPSAQYWGLPDANNKTWTQNLDYQVDHVRIYAAPA